MAFTEFPSIFQSRPAWAVGEPCGVAPVTGPGGRSMSNSLVRHPEGMVHQ